MKYTALPTWLLTIALLPFLKATHPMRQHKLTLERWASGRTQLTKQFDLVFWIVILEVILISLYKGLS